MALSPYKRGTIAMHIEKYGKTRYWAVRDAEEMLVCVCLYKRGALEVMRRLQILDQAQEGQDTSPVGEDISSTIAVSETG